MSRRTASKPFALETDDGSIVRRFKIPESVLVVVYTREMDVLLINRADAGEFWQSVTGSKDELAEELEQTAVREVREETGIDCAAGTPLHAGLRDWGLQNIYEIYPRWRHRYAPGVTRNTEHVFGLCVPAATPVTLNHRVNTPRYKWLPWREAADACFSPSNAEAILLLPQFR
jgi:dATP pyrophosphohydrolase